MQNIVDKLKYEQNRSSTQANYYSIWKKFNQFFIQLDVKPNSWEERLILFVGYLINNDKNLQLFDHTYQLLNQCSDRTVNTSMKTFICLNL